MLCKEALHWSHPHRIFKDHTMPYNSFLIQPHQPGADVVSGDVLDRHPSQLLAHTMPVDINFTGLHPAADHASPPAHTTGLPIPVLMVNNRFFCQCLPTFIIGLKGAHGTRESKSRCQSPYLPDLPTRPCHARTTRARARVSPTPRICAHYLLLPQSPPVSDWIYSCRLPTSGPSTARLIMRTI